MGLDQLLAPAWNTVRACGFWRKLLSQPKHPLLVPWETTHSHYTFKYHAHANVLQNANTHTHSPLHKGKTTPDHTSDYVEDEKNKEVSKGQKTVSRWEGMKYERLTLYKLQLQILEEPKYAAKINFCVVLVSAIECSWQYFWSNNSAFRVLFLCKNPAFWIQLLLFHVDVVE